MADAAEDEARAEAEGGADEEEEDAEAMIVIGRAVDMIPSRLS